MKLLFSKTTRTVVLVIAALFVYVGTDPTRFVDAAPRTAAAAVVAHPQLVLAIQVLESVKRTLEAADHDYGGHKGAAVHDIGKAEKQLREALGAPINGVAPRVPHIREPQMLSDYQLASAIPVLQETIVFLSASPTDLGGHRARAIADLRAAIAQLEKALEYSAVHNWGGDYRIFTRKRIIVVETRHKVTKHQQLLAVQKTKPLHHRVTLAGPNASARKQRIQQRQAYAKIKGPTNNHVLLQMKPHVPMHSVAARIHVIAKMHPPVGGGRRR